MHLTPKFDTHEVSPRKPPTTRTTRTDRVARQFKNIINDGEGNGAGYEGSVVPGPLRRCFPDVQLDEKGKGRLQNPAYEEWNSQARETIISTRYSDGYKGPTKGIGIY
eukprot:4136437-Pyramimonas_sp.AAC.1